MIIQGKQPPFILTGYVKSDGATVLIQARIWWLMKGVNIVLSTNSVLIEELEYISWLHYPRINHDLRGLNLVAVSIFFSF